MFRRLDRQTDERDNLARRDNSQPRREKDMGAVITIKAHGGKGASLGGLLGHCQRNTKQQQMIMRGKAKAQYDPARSHLNYDLAAADGKTAPGIMRLATLSQDMHINPGPNTNIAASWIWTMPEEYLKRIEYLPPEEARKKTKEFFSLIKEFLDERYCGAECCISASVHLDEYSPHMHYVFIPRVTNTKHEKNADAPKYKVSSSSLLTKKDLYAIHPELEAHLREKLGLSYVGMKKEATEEQREISRMKHSEYMKTKREAEQMRINYYQQTMSDFELRTQKMREVYGKESAEIAIAEKDAKQVKANVEQLMIAAQDGEYEVEVTAKGLLGEKKKKKKLPGKVLEQSQYDYLVSTAYRAAGASYDANHAKGKLEDAERRAREAEEKAQGATKAKDAMMRVVKALAEEGNLKFAVTRLLSLVDDGKADLQAEADRAIAMLKPSRAKTRETKKQQMQRTYLGR